MEYFIMVNLLVIVIVNVLLLFFLLIIIEIVGIFKEVNFWRFLVIVLFWLFSFVLIFGYVLVVFISIKIGKLNFLVNFVIFKVLW